MSYEGQFNPNSRFDSLRVDPTDPEEFDIASSPAPDGTVFKKRIGLKEYVLKSPDEATIEKWKAEVSTIIEAIKTRDVEKIREVIKFPYILQHWDQIFQNLEKVRGPLTEEEEIMLAISLWTIDRQGKWLGLPKGLKLVLSGGTHNLTDVIDHKIPTACVNSASVAEYLTELFGVKGLTKRTGGRISHRYWESDSGRVIDPWCGRELGGLFRSFDEYMAYRNPEHDVVERGSDSYH